MGYQNVKSNKLPEWEIFVFHKTQMTSKVTEPLSLSVCLQS